MEIWHFTVALNIANLELYTRKVNISFHIGKFNACRDQGKGPTI